MRINLIILLDILVVSVSLSILILGMFGDIVLIRMALFSLILSILNLVGVWNNKYTTLPLVLDAIFGFLSLIVFIRILFAGTNEYVPHFVAAFLVLIYLGLNMWAMYVNDLNKNNKQ